MNLAPEIIKEVFDVRTPSEMSLNQNREKITLLGVALKQHHLLAIESGTVYPVTLKSVNPLSFSSQKSKAGSLKTALANFLNHSSNESATCKLRTNCLVIYDFFL